MIRTALTWAVLGTLAACASGPEPVRDAAPSATAPAPASQQSPEASLGAFEQRQRDAAKLASQQGRWVEAIWAWDVVLALRPNDAAARAERDAAQATATGIAADRLARARQARQRGDNDGAVKLYLEALAVAPDDPVAADALRDIERAKTRRGSASAARTAQTAQRGSPNGDRNDFEHASILASQGEFESAIALLAPQTNDPRARSMLADIYWRQAQRLEAKDRAGAITALRRCLQLDPSHKLAADKLKNLTTLAGAG